MALHHRQRLANVESQRRVERKRAIVKRGLYQPHSGEVALPRAIQHRLHQLAPDAAILRLRIDGDGPQARDGIAFVQAIASGDAAVGFRHHAVKAGMREQLGQQARRPLPAPEHRAGNCDPC